MKSSSSGRYAGRPSRRLAAGEGEREESGTRRFELGAGVDAIDCVFFAEGSGGCWAAFATSASHPGGETIVVARVVDTTEVDDSPPQREADAA